MHRLLSLAGCDAAVAGNGVVALRPAGLAGARGAAATRYSLRTSAPWTATCWTARSTTVIEAGLCGSA